MLAKFIFRVPDHLIGPTPALYEQYNLLRDGRQLWIHKEVPDLVDIFCRAFEERMRVETIESAHLKERWDKGLRGMEEGTANSFLTTKGEPPPAREKHEILNRMIDEIRTRVLKPDSIRKERSEKIISKVEAVITELEKLIET